MPLSTPEKAQLINNDFAPPDDPGKINFRGSIAEIGAGQEVARHFFEAFGSSKTLVKTMSAYGKGCSNAIYGKTSGSYISSERLKTMIDYDHTLLVKRELTDDERPKDQQLRYFTFANTVDIATNKQGWAGVMVQDSGCSLVQPQFHTAVEYRVHFDLLTRDKATAIRIVGALGVNLIHAAIRHGSVGDMPNRGFVDALLENFERSLIRIDSISFKRFEVSRKKLSPTETNEDGITVEIKDVTDANAERLSEEFSIELVKQSSVRCATFSNASRSAKPSYTMFGRGEHLLLSRSTCDTDGLDLELEMLQIATARFREHLVRELGTHPTIRQAIHLPLLAVQQPLAGYSKLDVYIGRENEPKHNADHRIQLTENVPCKEVSIKIRRIVDTGCVALLSNFTSTSEAIKFLRTRTRFKVKPEHPRRDGDGEPPSAQYSGRIAVVLRADQLVGMLLNIEHRFMDREPLEIMGSIIRRMSKIYIYPCSGLMLVSGATLHGIDLRRALIDEAVDKLSQPTSQGARIGLDNLKTSLKRNYASLIDYMDAARCIDDLHPESNKFINHPLHEP